MGQLTIVTGVVCCPSSAILRSRRIRRIRRIRRFISLTDMGQSQLALPVSWHVWQYCCWHKMSSPSIRCNFSTLKGSGSELRSYKTSSHDADFLFCQSRCCLHDGSSTLTTKWPTFRSRFGRRVTICWRQNLDKFMPRRQFVFNAFLCWKSHLHIFVWSEQWSRCKRVRLAFIGEYGG